MYIMDDGIRLNAKIDMPSGWQEGTKVPLVIIIHGFTGHMEERHIIAAADALNQVGCATLRVDMYGHGHSDGEFRNHTLYKWLTNALTVIDYGVFSTPKIFVVWEGEILGRRLEMDSLQEIIQYINMLYGQEKEE